jgi:hypothetical protein
MQIQPQSNVLHHHVLADIRGKAEESVMDSNEVVRVAEKGMDAPSDSEEDMSKMFSTVCRVKKNVVSIFFVLNSS